MYVYIYIYVHSSSYLFTYIADPLDKANALWDRHSAVFFESMTNVGVMHVVGNNRVVPMN